MTEIYDAYLEHDQAEAEKTMMDAIRLFTSDPTNDQPAVSLSTYFEDDTTIDEYVILENINGVLAIYHVNHTRTDDDRLTLLSDDQAQPLIARREEWATG